MSNSSGYQIISPMICPHCNKDVFISSQFSLTNISSEEDLKKAKEQIKEGIKDIQFVSEEEKKNIFEMIDSEDFVRDLSNTESTIKEITIDQLNKIQSKNEQEKK